MNKQELIDFCLSLGATFADQPFVKMEKARPTTVIRHLKNKKCFAYISERSGDLIVAVKQNPEVSVELREFFKDISPAFHMNKVHWNDLRLGGDVADEQICKMIETSYDLTLK
ncbi:MmcQ/YjbR family DNA-binding protein [Lactococcus kimchii]|uniref:MmcQ/YjbR family DNA-binding protein n=1 Tax=Lactococcus sp. S-13 TaxID=2507158 RepID=UPI0010231AF0|nr:MmcQ/YjbR family DNA-binding protein [Lactococcus sp. S-13]RZI49318.1 MmcQ/YjbR family DNA-binding protein [Lactococcus sp. S-13]